MKIATLNSHRHFLVLLAILFWHSPLGAQDVDEGEFYLNFSGSAVFPYDPRGQLDNTALKAGTGFTAAFGYAFKDGFSTEMEWGYQKVGIGNPADNSSQDINTGGFASPVGFESPSITIEVDGEIKTQSLMGNVYYRYPKWRVSPYAGVGLGAFFHDGVFTSTVTVESELGTIGIPADILPYIEPFNIGFPTEPLRTTVAYEDSRFAYQIMGGLSAQISQHVEFHFGYRFRSSRGEPIDSDQIESGLRFRF